MTLAVRLKEAWHCDRAGALGEVHAMGCHRALAKQVTATAGSNADVLSGALAYSYAFASNDPAFRGIAGGVLWLVSSPQ